MSHGGGCGCKIAPAVLREILAKAGPSIVPEALLVGVETADDAAVYRINERQAIVATTDFFMPIVDDPHDFGAIAATNAISDVYAMGGTPLFALALVGMPVDKLPVDIIRAILAGGETACASAGIPIAGGHTIDSVEPIYGLVVVGLVDPANVKRNAGARPADRLVLGKPLGVGIYSAALKKEKLSAQGYAAMLADATQLNTPGVGSARRAGARDTDDGLRPAGHRLRSAAHRTLRRRIRADSAAPRRARARARRARHRRVGTQLGGIRAGCHARSRRHRYRAGVAHGSADLRRTAHCLRAGRDG
jgi:selenide,water dikinase